MNNIENFGSLFKKYRKQKNVYLKKIAKDTNISISHLSNIENNTKIPNTTHFIKLCEALQVTYDELKELHFEYEKLIKPQQAQELICVEFAKSEYIVSLLLEGMHFKDEFMGLYRQAYDGNKLILLNIFYMACAKLLSCYKNKDFINSEQMYETIDIYRKHSKELLTLQVRNLSEDEKQRLKEFLRIVIAYKNELKKFTKEKVLTHGFDGFFNEFSIKYKIQKIIKNYKEKLPSIFDFFTKIKIASSLSPKITNDLRIQYSEGTQKLLFNVIYIHFTSELTNILFDVKEAYLIELEDGSYKFANLKPLFNTFTIKDILTPESSPTENRFEFIFKEIKEVFDLAVDVLPIPKDDSSKAVYLEKITKFIYTLKKRLLYVNNKLNELKQLEQNTSKILDEKNALDINTKYLKSKLKQYEEEISNLKQQLDDMKKEKE